MLRLNANGQAKLRVKRRRNIDLAQAGEADFGHRSTGFQTPQRFDPAIHDPGAPDATYSHAQPLCVIQQATANGVGAAIEIHVKVAGG